MFADGFGWGFAFGMLAALVAQTTGRDRTLWVVADDNFCFGWSSWAGAILRGVSASMMD
jgi:hypothetical protein